MEPGLAVDVGAGEAMEADYPLKPFHLKKLLSFYID
jgi:hypothetical protein